MRTRACVICVALTAALLSVRAEPPPAADGIAVGSVLFSKGKVTITCPAGDVREGTAKAPVFKNDRVVCQGGSKVQILFADDSVVWLGENTEIVIDDYVYVPEQKDKVSCALRFVKGAFRVVTGAITKLNPDRFKVRTRMATVGIRGCEVGIGGQGSRNDIYVLAVAKTETIVIESTVDGKAMMDVITGEQLPIDEATRRIMSIDRAGVVVSVLEGKGADQQEIRREDLDLFMRSTSHLPPAKYELLQNSDWSVFTIKPPSGDAPQSQTEPK